jgi:deoxyhypusine synthase
LVPCAQCLGPTYTGDFELRGADLRKRGLNRVGNLLVPNSNYCAFEDWVMPILDAMKAEQDTASTSWTPSKAGAWLLAVIAVLSACLSCHCMHALL